MSILENRLSTTVVSAEYLEPDSFPRYSWLQDHERGPIAVTDTSEGNIYQNWELNWEQSTGNFILTPETTGSPVIALNAANVTQCTFTFDQNARPCFGYTANDVPYLYWYDTLAEAFVTTNLGGDVLTPSVTLDDKRQIHVDRNDILLFYTKNMGNGTYNLYYKQQRDRYTIERLLQTDIPPRLKKFGMHAGLRVQLSAVYDVVI